MKKTAVVICPGRGTYNKDELGYLQRFHGDKTALVQAVDAVRRDSGQTPISDLDRAERFRMSTHLTGDNASALIYACAMADIASIDRDRFDIIAVTGNSMGWYLALAAGGATDLSGGAQVVNTMGTLMHEHAEGGQIIYPICDDQWRFGPQLVKDLEACMAAAKEEGKQVSASIDLGYFSVIAGDEAGIRYLLEHLPKVQDRYPMRLPNHGAFHSELMRPVSNLGQTKISKSLLRAPELPLIDGRGHIWQPYNSERDALYSYTFDHQVCRTYDFSAAVEVACKEFAPDCLIIPGPGATLGPPVAQQLIKMHWRGIDSKDSFKQQQRDDPFVLSMGVPQQRALAVSQQ